MYSDFISQTNSTAIDIGTFAILISIMVGIVTVWSAIRAARNEAKKAASLLEEIRSDSLNKLVADLSEIKNKIGILEIKYSDRMRMMEKSLNRIEESHWHSREDEDDK